MSVGYKPDGYTTVSPYLVVDGAAGTIGDPDKRGGVRDAGGTTWWVASKTA